MMRRTISSLQTFFLKFIFSGLFVGVACWLLVRLLVELARTPGNIPPFVIFFPLLWSVAAFAGCYYLTIPLKHVSVDEKHLYVSNYLKEITIPLADIERVTHLRFFNIQPVIIHLKSASEFGRKIRFVPQLEFRWGWKEHSIVSELRELAQSETRGAIFRR